MKKFILFLLIGLSISSSYASDLDQVFCNQSDACKKYCGLRENNKFDENNSSHEDLMVECLGSLSDAQKIKDDLTKTVTNFDQELCNKTTSCRKYCDLREKNQFDEQNAAHKNIMLKCLKYLTSQ